MSFTRAPLYVWSSEFNQRHTLHIWVRPGVPASIACVDPVEPEDYEMEGGIAIEEKHFMEIALAVMSNYSPKQLSALCRKVAKPEGPFAGNFGVDQEGLERIHKSFSPNGKTLWPEGVCERHTEVYVRNGECWACKVEASRKAG